MASYIDIHGNNIPIRSSDPSNPIFGEMWYNTSTSTLKGYVYAPSAFSTANVLPTATMGGLGGGTITAGLVATGDYPGGRSNVTMEYDGTNWTVGGTYPVSYTQVGGGGTQASMIAAGGGPPWTNNLTNSYNGTAWSGETGYPTNIRGSDGGGTGETASFVGGGENYNTGVNAFNLYNGSSWTAGAANPAANFNKFVGTQTAVLAVENGPGATQSFNGTSWTTLNPALPTPSGNMYGDLTAAVNGCTSQPAGALPAQEWDGTCWAAGGIPALPNYRLRTTCQTGTAGAGFFAGSYPGAAPPTSSNDVEEYSAAAATTVTVTAS